MDDLEGRLGSEVTTIRTSLGADEDITVVIAQCRQADGEVALVATRSGVLVHPLGDTTIPDLPDARARWATVRVSPVVATPEDDVPSCWCEVRVGDDPYLVTGSGADGCAAVEAFHDEVVRRGTPWHAP
ncbi:MAG: hypothetical protein KF809_00210 [Chloroflexi bacterium]|nr:hypothetical protein [Chloroflexota bacterium]